MRPIAERRKEFMKDLTEMLDTLDPTGDNTKIYEEFFGNMTDDQFDKYMIEFFNNPKANIYLEIVEFERELTLENIEKYAKKIGVPLMETIAIPYLTGDPDNVVVSPEPVPVGYIHAKRLQQTVLKKNGGSINIDQRNPRTGQVTDHDKNARNSDAETYGMLAIGAVKALEEFMGPRADNMRAKNEMYKLIGQNGFVSIDELSNDPEDKVALNTLNEDFIMQGITTNLVNPLGVIQVLKEK